MAIQTGSIDLKAQKEAHDAASQTASSFITEITGGGIQVHPASNTNDYTQIDANGVKLYKGGVQVAEFGTSVNFYDGQGSASSNIVAQFGASGATIGKSGESHIEIDSASIRGTNEDGYSFFEIDNDIDYANANIFSRLTIDNPEKGVTYEYDLQEAFSVMPSTGTLVYLPVSATYTDGSDSEGADGVVSFYYGTSLSGSKRVFGNDTPVAMVTYSYDADTDTVSLSWAYSGTGFVFHWFGYARYVADTKASAIVVGSTRKQPTGKSIAVGEGLTAGNNQIVVGKWNREDVNGKYALIVGNGIAPWGSSRNFKDAFAIDWDGYIYPMAEKMPDWVVAQGTSGIWTYRKWHSGIAECWGTYSASIAITYSSPSYGGYRSTQITATSFPSGVFDAAPLVTATSMSSGGNWVTNVADSTATAIKFFLSCGTSSNASTRNIAFHAMGRWK